MANVSYSAFRSGVLTGDYDLDTAVIKVALVRGYTFSAAHATLADVVAAGGVINGTPGVLSNVTVVDGVLDADDCQVSTVFSSTPHVLVVYQASAVSGGADVAAGSQRLIFHFDTGSSFPIVPGTGSTTIAWPSGASKIYKLG